MGGDYTDIPPHDLHPGQIAAQRAGLRQGKALGTDGGGDALVGHAGDGQHGFLADVQMPVLYLTIKDVDGRRAQKFCHKKIHGRIVNRLRLADLLYHAVPHDHDQVGDGHGFLLIVGDEYGGDAGGLLDAADLLPGLEPQTGVQIGKGFVQQQNSRHFHQRPGNGHALLLATGQLLGLAVHQFFNLHQLRRFQRHVGHLLVGELVLARPVFQRESNILPYRQMGIQGVILEHQPHAPVLRRQVGDVVVAEEDTAGGRLLQSGEQVQRGGLAAARRAEQTQQHAVGDLKGEVVHGDHVGGLLFVAAGELFRQILQRYFHGTTVLSKRCLHYMPQSYAFQEKRII